MYPIACGKPRHRALWSSGFWGATATVGVCAGCLVSDGLSWDSLKVLGLPRRMELLGTLGGSLGSLGVEG